MKKCNRCNSKFSYKELLNSFLNFDYSESLECKKCKTKYKISIVSRIIFPIALVIIPLSLIKSLDISGSIATIGYLIYALILFISAPVFIIYKLSSTNEWL